MSKEIEKINRKEQDGLESDKSEADEIDQRENRELFKSMETPTKG